uniref:Uncharacterized protein n=1 Tax=Anguilla anguilla TaxID=7936 RepID=A0A0E9X247_ANGAN
MIVVPYITSGGVDFLDFCFRDLNLILSFFILKYLDFKNTKMLIVLRTEIGTLCPYTITGFIHYMAKSMWTPDISFKIMGISEVGH